MIGLSNNFETISDASKTAVLNKEFLCLQVDIATLQDTHFVEWVSMKEADYIFFWWGKLENELESWNKGQTPILTFLGFEPMTCCVPVL